MAKNQNPFQILSPDERWAPSQSQIDAFQNVYEKLLPPLVHKIRSAVTKWRDSEYAGASETSKALLRFWFEEEHFVNQFQFRFFFSQREAIESVIYLYEVAKARDKYDMMRFDASGRISTGMFEEEWTRYMVKMATGAGKTKVMGLVIVWSYFHKLYEANSDLSKNFLLIAPNIIVLNRLRKDFDGLKMFLEEPFLPENGWENRDWKDDLQLTLHIQDELKPITENGNIFLTNIHRVPLNEDPVPSSETKFLGHKPKVDADTSKGADLGKVLRSEKIKDLVILNDEAHHVHDKSLVWFQNIEDIANKLKLKGGKGLSLQADFSATPKHNNGHIFVQTICDFPLVEAIRQNVVKSPVLPDEESRNKIKVKESNDFIEKYQDFIHLGYLEWQGQYEELKDKKTPILFIMTMNTKEADEAAAFLERSYPIMKDAVLTIHTNNSGNVKEGTSKKDKEELDRLRKAADDIDKDFSPYKAVVSVLMLREGWDVRNVTTIVGLRPFGADSKILPEQTIGRGLRKMFDLEVPEKLVVVGTPPFLDFVESLKSEGVEFQYSPMGKGTGGKSPIIIEVDKESGKDLDKLDIPLPQLSQKIYREFKNLENIDTQLFEFTKIDFKTYPPQDLIEIVFKHIDDEFSHKTTFSETSAGYRSVIAFFTTAILKDSRLFSGFNILYPKVEHFVKYQLFGNEIGFEDSQTIKNLSDVLAKDLILKLFRAAINAITVKEDDNVSIKGYTSLKNVKPKVVGNQRYLLSEKCIFNKVIGDNNFELGVAKVLNGCADVVAFAKNAVGEGSANFFVEYQKENGNIALYYPDFLIKTSPTTFFILETKGREDLNDVRKIKRLAAWCADVNALQTEHTYTAIYIRQEDWDEKYADIKNFRQIIQLFEFK